jgi:glycosyltransferase involved in cell wall biosynthesis
MSVRKVLNISSGDLVGSRFNGFDWRDALLNHGIESTLAAHWNIHSEEEWVVPVSQRYSTGRYRKFSRHFFLQALDMGSDVSNYPWSKDIFNLPSYIEADLVHLQVVHDGTLDVSTIERIIKEKPVVWTWHDPWPLTGHCIYPMTCSEFKSGCGQCPDLQRAFSIGRDLAHKNLIRKSQMWELDFTLHVSTNWFKDLITERLPDTKPRNLSVLPFGLDINRFNSSAKNASRVRFKIKEGNLVIGIRAVTEYQKNFDLFLRSLRILPDHIKNRISIVTIQNSGMLDSIEDLSQVVELPWSNDPKTISDFYDSLDIFIMPSRYETFGFMSLEAMAHGIPVVGLANTAIDEICQLEINGFRLMQDSPLELANTIISLALDRTSLIEKSELGKKWVSDKFDLPAFIDNLVSMYRETYRSFWSRNG